MVQPSRCLMLKLVQGLGVNTVLLSVPGVAQIPTSRKLDKPGNIHSSKERKAAHLLVATLASVVSGALAPSFQHRHELEPQAGLMSRWMSLAFRNV